MAKYLDMAHDWLGARSPALRRRHLVKAMEEAKILPRRMVLAPKSDRAEAAEATFRTAGGYDLPVQERHRYRLVRGVTYLPELAWLYDLERLRLLSSADLCEFKRIVGTRTLAVPLDEARAWSLGIANRYDLHLVKGSIDAGCPVYTPSDEQLASLLTAFANSNRTLCERAAAARGAEIRTGAKILEIGFTSGGTSIFAWEQMGFQVAGIDNLYAGVAGRPVLHEDLARRLNSKANFVIGDITQRTPFDDNSFDMIFSISVLEHVADLPAAFREMRRLLKPGGYLLHRYNPFFAANGGHSWGALDCPWGHIRLSREDHLRYVDELRPHEASHVRPWVATAMNEAASLTYMQRALAEAGFRIALWEEHPEPPDEVGLLGPEGLRQIFEHYPQIGLSDIFTREVIFSAS